MYVARIELTNYFRFRSVAVDLEPRVYAVEAEMNGDPGRSNWIGKSSFAEAIPFALYGWHRFQEGERAPGFEDEWIKEGESEGSVAHVLSCGTRVERSRKRGASTQLRVTLPNGNTCAGDAAQEHVERIVGLSKDDFFSTAFVRQKRCSQIVTARPADRMGLVADWLDFGALERATADLGQRLTAAANERERLLGKVTDLRARIVTASEETFPTVDGDDRPISKLAPAEWERSFKLLTEDAAREVAAAEEAVTRWSIWSAAETVRVRAESARAQLAEERARLADLPEVEPVDAGPAVAKRRLAQAKVEDAQRLARGDFDGRCPVRTGFVCPARGELNAGQEEARYALEQARSEHAKARDEADAVERKARDAVDAQRVRDRQEERVEVLRRQVDATPAQPAGARPEEVTRARLDAARSRVQQVATAVSLYRRCAADLGKLHADLQKAEEQLADAERRIVCTRAARLVCGRGGAQRRIAEAAVAAIASGANRRLAARGIDLRVSLSWRREGADWAPSCEACGASYPRSAKVRSCARCGAERGKAVQDRLDVHLSDRSGAAEDLAGLMLQRSACAFLRGRRGAAWSSLVLDEPFGALDGRHREVMAQSLAAIGSEDGFEQAFVLAHQPGILESLPGKILIRGDGDVSTAEVVE